MFDLDRWQEIFSSIRSNMLRTVLSGFTVALGLYIFIVLFGIGNGLKNAFNDGFRSAQNLISISSGRASLPYAGLQADRLISFNNDDLEAVTTENKKKHRIFLADIFLLLDSEIRQRKWQLRHKRRW